MNTVSFGIVGGGFRAECFLRVACALPEQFSVSGMVVRDGKRGHVIEERWSVPTYRNLDDLCKAQRPDFMVVSVKPSSCADYLWELADRGIPALAETPPAATLEDLVKLHDLTRHRAPIQVAEQYQFRPMHQARIEIVKSGLLGPITQADVSISHGYHGISLLRKFLGVRFAEARIMGTRFTSPMIAGPTRLGLPKEERILMSERDLAWIRWGDQLGIYDFTKDQHRSWIRATHIRVRGIRGEIHDNHVQALLEYDTPFYVDLRRVNRGEEENVEGYFLSGILLGERWVYRNPYAPACLNDDEIAVATCLSKMAGYIHGGESFYDLQEASQDHYLAMLIEQSIQTGQEVRSASFAWMENNQR